MLSIRASQLKALGRPMSGQTWNPFTVQQCAYDGNLHVSITGEIFLFKEGAPAICIPFGIVSSMVGLFFSLKRSSFFSLIHKTNFRVWREPND